LSVCVSINRNFVFLYFAIFVMGWGCLGPRPFLSAGMYTCVCARVRVCTHFHEHDMVVNHSGTMFISGTVCAQVCHTMIVIVRYVVKLCPRLKTRRPSFRCVAQLNLVFLLHTMSPKAWWPDVAVKGLQWITDKEGSVV
jgi:hypothetical protein